MLRSLMVVVVTALYIAVAGSVFIPYAMLTGNDALLFRVGVLGARLALWLAGVRVRVEGRERLRPDSTYVFMSNHVGNADPPALVAYLPQRVAAIAKHKVFQVPLMGRALRLAGFISVVRDTPQASAAVDAGVAALRGGRSMVVFPEGTRSRTGEMLPFRRGVFLMAIRAGVSIVPVTILGSREIMRKGDPRIYPGLIRIVLHDPIPTAGLREEDRYALADRVREVIASALPAPAPAESPASAAAPRAGVV